MINKYNFGKIYKLVSNKSDDIYVGSTCLPLQTRLWRHITQSKRTINKLYSEMSRLGLGGFKIELIEAYPCNDNVELLEREAYWINELKPSLNTNKLSKNVYCIKINSHINILRMVSNDSENNSSSSDEQKNPVGRPRTSQWRYEREDGKYNNNPISPTYYKDYYHEKLAVKVVCEFCGSTVNKQKLNSQHQQSKICLKFQRST